MEVSSFGAADSLSRLDRRLIDPATNGQLAGVARFVVEFLYFGVKEVRACLFAGLFFTAVFLMTSGTRRAGICSAITRPSP